MLRRKPLFPGKHFMQQLWLIFGLLGAPTEKEVSDVSSQEALRFLQQVAGLAGRPFDEFFSAAEGDPDTLDLLRCLLVFDSERRLSAAQVLKHKYLSKLEYLSKVGCPWSGWQGGGVRGRVRRGGRCQAKPALLLRLS